MENKHYDIGLVGWWHNSNYGSMLTYYALHQTLKNLGYSVLMIHEALGYPNRVKWDYNNPPHKFAKKHYDFREQVNYSELGKYNDECNTFIVGSDQLWNPHIGRVNSDCFLDFTADDKKRISYGTSFGNEGVLGSRPEFVKVNYDNLRRFDAISVREDYAVKVAEDNFNVKAVRVVDPVFLPDISEYIFLAEQASNRIDGEYMLAFILDPTEAKKNIVLRLAEKLGYKKIFVLTDPFQSAITKAEQIFDAPNMEMYKLEQISPENFLCAYQNAGYVITDSFHGTCFSYIFRKNFNVFYNILRGAGRFASVVGLMGLESRRIYEDWHTEPDTSAIDFAQAEKNVNKLREYSLNWLKTALETPKSEMPDIILQDSRAKGKAITSILNINNCTGCGACVSVCPKNALSLQQDKWGYYCSSLNAELCIDCGLCSKICPALSLPHKANKKEPPLYAFIAADEKILYSSSSGGIFSLLANEAFKRGGCVAGAAWTGDLHVEHILIENKEELYKLQKSKYLQSYLGDFDRNIKEKLDSGRFVLFSGCPCQVTGLKSYLGKDYDNLITVDLLCGNSPSSEFFQKYLKNSFPGGVKDYQFRYKKQGWNSDCLTITLTDGTKIERRGGGQDDYQKLYHPHVMCPPHCEQCKYQALPRFGDITIGDFWGYSKHDSSIDTSKGISAVLCNNEKGRVFFDSIPDEEIKVKKNVPLEWLGGNGFAYTGHNYCSPNRDKFYKAIQTMSFSEAMKTALTPNKLSSYPDPLSLQPLHYDTSQLRFRFDTDMWEEHFINGAAVLTTKVNDPPLGNYAVIPLMHSLVKDKRYRLSVRFRVKTSSDVFSFHIKGSDSKNVQVVYTHNVKPENAAQWVTVKTDFTPGNNTYDEFMVGSAQIRGEGRFFAVDYIDISETETSDLKLKNQLTWMTNAANFFEALSKDFCSGNKFNSFMKNMRGKNIAVLKMQDKAGQFMLRAAEAYGVRVVFSSSKSCLDKLTESEWQQCKTADKIVCCCVHGTSPGEREGIKAISIRDLVK